MNLTILTIVFQRILIVMFFIIISIPFFPMILGDKTLISVVEKRALAEFPSVPENYSQVQHFFPDMEEYLNDHFGFREWMIYRYQREVRKRFDDTSNVTEVIKGVDNWYFFTGNDMLEDFTGRNLLSDDDLNEWVQSYREKKKWLEDKGIRYLFVVAPNKMSIYSKFVGAPWVDNQGMGRLTQIKKQFSDSDNSTLLDLTPSLRKMNHLDTLYFKSDTHWTSYGAFLAYQVIAERVESMFPDIRFKRDFTMTPVLERRCDMENDNCGGLTDMLLDYESFDESYRKVEKFPKCSRRLPFDFELSNLSSGHKEFYFHTNCENGTLKAVVFRDSFFSDLEPFLSENFKEVIYLWKEYDQNNIEELLSTFKPDIIIEERVERIL
jgi:alginate O-acetyltransferase complex protein AlgJ